jgi:hypothetical protein
METFAENFIKHLDEDFGQRFQLLNTAVEPQDSRQLNKALHQLREDGTTPI